MLRFAISVRKTTITYIKLQFSRLVRLKVAFCSTNDVISCRIVQCQFNVARSVAKKIDANVHCCTSSKHFGYNDQITLLFGFVIAVEIIMLLIYLHFCFGDAINSLGLAAIVDWDFLFTRYI